LKAGSAERRNPPLLQPFAGARANGFQLAFEAAGGIIVQKLWPPLKTYPQVSQFWTYDPKQFVRQPVFSRDFPPSKYLD
jgi:branched-chain amino acid transport system substrate-binding protein